MYYAAIVAKNNYYVLQEYGFERYFIPSQRRVCWYD